MSTAVLAHGFGIRYDLKLPLALYLGAAGAVVALSFVLVALFVRGGGEEHVYPRKVLSRPAPLGREPGGPRPRAVLGTVGVLVLAAIIVCGFFGAPDATSNPAEYLLWIYFWAATVVLSGIVGNLYALANPFSAIYDAARRLLPRGTGTALRPVLRYPDRLGLWPSVGGYFLFAFFELASGESAHPRSVALAAVGYTIYTLAAMVLFGRDTWLKRGEFFAVLFRLVGSVGVIGTVDGDRGRVVELRPPAVGLTRLRDQGWDLVAFVILTLSSLAFDGLSATPAWANLYIAVLPSFDPLGALGPIVIRGLGLLGVTVLFFAIYGMFIELVNRFGGGRHPLVQTASLFAFTLIPIALVYNAAHNYSYMVIQGQGILPLLADPLARGWRLLPTSGYKPSFAPADPGFVWLLQVFLIVLGHVVAVYLAHLRAMRLFKDRARSLRSQYPMLALMVLYTITSLYILAQPITEAG